MHRILITGMSGVGKSSVIEALAARGYDAVDLDDPAYSAWVDVAGEGPSPGHPGQDWMWREDRVRSLLSREDAGLLVVSGCSANQGTFRDRFDRVILLSAPAPVMVQRLTSRTSNAYGQDPAEVDRSLEFKETVEPLIRAGADVEIDTQPPLDEVVAAVLTVVTRLTDGPEASDPAAR